MTTIEQRPAHPGNFTKGRSVRPDRVLIHVADGTYAGTLSWFQNPQCNTSAHYTVATDGRVGQSVSESDTAWHAGQWEMNERSIGIEHEGQPSRGPWTPSAAQLEASARLVADICRRYGIPADRVHVIGHNEVNPGRAARANCPGPTWPWDAYLRRVNELLAPQPAHTPDTRTDRTVRLFDPATNTQVGEGTLVGGTDKVYLRVTK
ncbi:N-acetylmuramoyl-L-alanine amidase [Deinococcus sp. PEB2-63]